MLRTQRGLPAQTVLVIDDEPGICQIVTRLLARRGVHVLIATSGTQAIATYTDHHNTIDLVLIDQHLPDMLGSTVCTTLAAIDPHVPIVVMSGSQDSELDSLAVAGRLDKPFTMDGLLGTLNVGRQRVSTSYAAD